MEYMVTVPKQSNVEVAGTIWAIRDLPVIPEVQESRQLGKSISLEEAKIKFGAAEILSSPMVCI